MNIIVLIVRIIAGITFFSLAVRMANGRYTYAGLAAVVIGLIVSFPVFRMLYKKQKPFPAARLRLAKDQGILFRWIRKGIAIFLCLLVVGAFQRYKYQEGIVFSLICIVFLSPLDALFFGPPIPELRRTPRQSFRDVMIISFRNAGLVLYTVGVNSFVDHVNDKEDRALIITGMAMLFARPVAMLLAPRKLVPPAPGTITGPTPATVTAPTSVTGPASVTAPTSVIAPTPVTAPTPVIAPPPVPDPVMPSPPVTPDLAALRAAYTLITALPPQKRGYAFQDFLNTLFTAHHISARGAFRLVGEEIDGSFELGAQTYLVEAKWQAKLTPQSDLAVFNSKVEGKSTWARGLFISHAGFTTDGLKAFAHGRRTSIIGMDGQDIQLILEGAISLEDAIRRKALRAVESNEFFVPLGELI